MCAALRKSGLSRLLAIAFTAIVAWGEIRQAAADDAGTNAPAASEDRFLFPDGPASTELYDQIAHEQSSISTLRTFATVSLSVTWMLAGFALIEIGLSHCKNIGRTLSRNFLIYPLAGLAFWLYGFAFGWGNWFNGPVPLGWLAALGPGASVLDRGLGIGEDPALPGVFKYGLLGTKGFCLHGVDDPSVIKLFFSMMPFLITAAAIPIGALAERWRLKSFLLYGLWVALPYSVYANWLWGGGWLAQAGLNWGLGHGAVDFAGSGVVFGMGGIIAIVGCIVLGPRVGSRAVNEPRIVPLHNSVVIGTVILLSFWLVENTPLAVNMTLSTFTGALGALLCLKLRGKSVDAAAVCRGLLAGMAAIAGSCAFVDGIGAAIVSGVAGILCVLSVSFCDRMGVDDATGAISVFGTGGIWGVVALGLFANGHFGDGWNGVIRPAFVEKYGSDGVRGLFYGDPSQFAAQLLAAGVLIVFGVIMAFAWFRLSNRVVSMRVGKEAE